MIEPNGEQLYGLKRLTATLRMGRHPVLRGLPLKKKLALHRAAKQSKLTRLGGEIYSNTFTPAYPSPAYDRYLKGVLSVSSGRPLPVITNFAVTAQCPCNCWHCSFADREKKDRLSLPVLKQAIADAQDLGSSVIGLTGGEPLLRKDLEDIIACIGERSMAIMFTTGFGLDSDRVRRLKEAGLKIPVISLDHYRPEIHDKGRGRQGVHQAALEAIRMFQDQGFYVAVSFVPDRALVEDREELWKIIDFFRELGLNDMRLTSPILSGRLTARPEEKLTPENVRTIHEVQTQCTAAPGYPGVFAYDYFESRRFYGCGAGFNYMFIDSQGNLCPCDFTMMSLGNILERPMADIWGETSRMFRAPGCDCYANVINDTVAARKPKAWPLGPEETRAVHAQCPSYDLGDLPEFYRGMCFRPGPGEGQ